MADHAGARPDQTANNPSLWSATAASPPPHRTTSSRILHVGLVNNMRGPGFRDSDRQFRRVIGKAAPARITVAVTGYTITDPPPGTAAIGYHALQTLDDAAPDALIITGTEPVTDDLRHEACYTPLARLIDRAIDRRIPLLFSCLAAHAAVLHLSGIARRPLANKCHGVLTFARQSDHALTAGMRPHIAVPHSRWNTLDAADLTASGYQMLFASPRHGVDRFVHADAPGCVFLQGHPEYDGSSLRGEYRRDVRRYLAHETQHYPTIPPGCFDAATCTALKIFQHQAMCDRQIESLAALPLPADTAPESPQWQNDTMRFYRNWLASVAAGAGIPLPYDI